MIGLIIAAAFAAEILLVIFLPAVGLSILGLLLFLLLFVLFVPVGIHGRYVEEKFFLAAKVSRFEYTIFPRPKKEGEKKKNKTEHGNNKKSESEPEVKKEKKFPFNFEETLELLKKAVKSLGKFGKLTVHKFILHYLAAGNDPYKTAMTYNYVNAALSSLTPVCAKSFIVKDDVDVWTNIEFTQEKQIIEAELSITLRLAQLLRVAFVFVFSALGILVRNRRRLRRENRENKNKAATNNTDDEKTNINTEERMDSNG